MKDHFWPTEVSERLSEHLAGAFTGVDFRTAPLEVYDVATIDVAWTNGPALHEVDLVALEFILRANLDTWGTPQASGVRIDRISKRRTMSPAAEEMLMKVLAADLGVGADDPDIERLHALPPVLTGCRFGADKGTILEFLDLLFESTSFTGEEAADGYIGGQESLLCRCTLCVKPAFSL